MKTCDKRNKGIHGVIDRLRKAFKAKDEEKIEEALGEAEEALGEAEEGAEDRRARDEGGDETHIHIHSDRDGKLPQTGEDLNGRPMAHDDEANEQRLQNLEKGHEEIKDSLSRVHDDIEGIKEHLGIKSGEEESHDDKEIEGELEEEAPPGTGDRARKAHDSSYLSDSFSETVAAAEILVPGIRIPTYDRKADPKKTFDAICKLRRTALDLAYAQPETRGIIEEANGRALALDQMSCGAVRTLFRASVAMRKAANNTAARRTGDVTAAGKPVHSNVTSIAELNARNAAYWATKNSA